MTVKVGYSEETKTLHPPKLLLYLDLKVGCSEKTKTFHPLKFLPYLDLSWLTEV